MTDYLFAINEKLGEAVRTGPVSTAAAQCNAEDLTHNIAHAMRSVCAACSVQRATCSVQRAACNVQRATCSRQRATCSRQRASRNVQQATCNMHLPSVWWDRVT